MAEDGLFVTTSGAALSVLFYETVRSTGDQMGFLLGETVKYVLKTLTDADRQEETIKIHINVQAVLTCPIASVLHDSIGRINKEKLKEFLQDTSQEVIGWFQFRQNMPLVPTLKDKILHKQFVSHFSDNNGSKEEFFVMCLLNSSINESRSTHKFRHVFLRHKRSTFEPIPVKINNLGNDATRHDGSDYKPSPAVRSIDKPDAFTKMIECINLDPINVSGVEAVTAIQRTAEQYLNSVIQEISESDREVANLERQVHELRGKLFHYDSLKRPSINGSPEATSLITESEKEGRNDKNLIIKTEKESSDSEDVETMNNALPPKIDSSNEILENTRLRKSYTTSAVHSQTMTPQKYRDTASSIAKSLNQKSRKPDAEMDAQSSPHDDTGNISSETKIDVAENTTSRNRQLPESFSGIAGQSICKKEYNGAGRGKTPANISTNLKKTRRTSVPGQSCNVKINQLSKEEDSMSSPLQISKYPYSQALKKNMDNTRSFSETSDNQ